MTLRHKIETGIFAFVTLGLGAVAAWLYVSGSNVNGESVVIRFNRPEEAVAAGKPFPLGITFSNISDKTLEDVRLSVMIPEGVSLAGQKEGQRVIEEQTETLAPGSIGQRNFEFIASDGRLLKTFEAKITYRIQGSKAKFEQPPASVDVSIGSSAIELTVEAPEKVYTGEEFAMVLKYQNTGESPISDIRLRLEYPKEFRIKDVVPKTETLGEWSIAILAPSKEESVTIRGTIEGEAGISFPFVATMLGDYSGESYVVNKKNISIGIAESPLTVSVLLPNTKIARAGETLEYRIGYKNNSDVSFRDVVIRAKFTGELYRLQNIETEGVFRAANNTVTWIAANTPPLLVLSPGEEGEVRVKVPLSQDFPIQRLGDKDFILLVEASIESPTVPSGTSAEKTVAFASLETKVMGKITIDTRGLFHDAASGILNAGPYPPKVGVTTQYTIHWIIKNYSTDARNIKVFAFLQSGARWTGKVKTNTGIDPKYNENTGEVTWELPIIQAGKGVIGSPVEAIFQIEYIPEANAAGREATLIGETKLVAEDSFTNLSLSSSDTGISTMLPDDPSPSGIIRP